MESFEFCTPTKFYFGKGVEKNTGKYLKDRDVKKVLLVQYGTGRQGEIDLYNTVVKSLDEAGIEHVLFEGIKPNPIYETCEVGKNLARKEGVDFILALGGGSVIDTCKYISIAFYHDGDAYEDFYLKPGLPKKALPVGSITTIAGTGSEASNSSVVTKNGSKRSFNNDIIRPAVAILDPELTYTVPKFQTAAGGVDIMAHVHERYFTLDRNTFLTDGLCEAIFRTVIKYLPIAYNDPTNYEARASLLWASIIGHNESVGVGRAFPPRYGLAHTIQSEIGGKYDSNHGAGCACVTIGMMKYLYKRDIPRFERYFNQVWNLPIDTLDPENMILSGIKMQEDFYHSLGISTDIKDYGVKAEDLDDLIATTRRGPDGLISGMKLNDEDLRNIYHLMGV